MKMSRRKGIFFTTLITILLLLPVSLANASPTEADSEYDQVLLRDAKAYAEYENVSIEEAMERLRLMDVAGSLHAELINEEAKTFGNSWIEHNPEFKMIVQFTQNGNQTMQTYLEEYPELSSLIEIRKAKISYQDLRKIQIKLMDDLESIGFLAASEPDIKTGRINLYVLNESELSQATSDNRIFIPENVDVIQVPRLSKLCDVIGGKEITSGDAGATTGFGAVDGATEVITTAGHFYNDSGGNPTALYEDTVTLDFVTSKLTSLGWGTDIAWYDPESGYDVTNRIQDSSSSTRGILWVEDYDDIQTGDYIFKYGQSTDLTVGQVSECGFSYRGFSDYVKVAPISGTMCLDGDSGGPCFRGYTAIGSLCGDPPGGGTDMYFYPVSDLSTTYGVNVLTSP